MTDVDDMVLFAEVVKAGSFTKAADLLGRPKSSISYRISKLESELGVLLLERSTRKIRLTEVGKVLLQHCTNIIDEVAQATNVVESLSQKPRGLLKVSASYSVGRQLLGPITTQYLQQYPEANVHLVLSNRRVDIIEEGFDLAIRVGPLNNSNLVAKKIGGSRLSFCASVEYLNLKGEPISLQELTGHRLLHMSEYDFPSSIKLQGPNGQETLQIPLRGVINDFHLLKQMVLDGVGIAILPTYLYYEELREGSLVEILPEWSMPAVDFHAIFPSHRGMTPKLRAYLELLESHLAERSCTSVYS